MSGSVLSEVQRDARTALGFAAMFVAVTVLAILVGSPIAAGAGAFGVVAELWIRRWLLRGGR